MSSPNGSDDVTEQTVSRLLDENKRLRDRVYVLEQRCEELYWNYTTRPERVKDRVGARLHGLNLKSRTVLKRILPNSLVEKLRS